MIIIISETTDKVTDNVIDWLFFYKYTKIIRINENDLITAININDNDIFITIKDRVIKLSEIKSFWHRRGFLSYSKICDLKKHEFSKEINNHLCDEWYSMRNYIYNELYKKKGIFNKKGNVNKIIILKLAKEIGFKIPCFCITDNKNEIPDNPLIIKAISDSIDIYTENFHETFYTEKYSIGDNNFDTFFPTFFQEAIKKKIDIRTIYVKGNIWSMAINNENKVDIDFRKNYDALRCSPYKLPKEIEIKLHKIMNKLEMDFGAIDFVLDYNDNVFLLEINPYGQFEMVSAPCNYQIEKKIAQILLTNA